MLLYRHIPMFRRFQFTVSSGLIDQCKVSYAMMIRVLASHATNAMGYLFQKIFVVQLHFPAVPAAAPECNRFNTMTTSNVQTADLFLKTFSVGVNVQMA